MIDRCRTTNSIRNLRWEKRETIFIFELFTHEAMISIYLKLSIVADRDPYIYFGAHRLLRLSTRNPRWKPRSCVLSHTYAICVIKHYHVIKMAYYLI